MIENLFTNHEIKEIPGCLRIGVDYDNVIVATGRKMKQAVNKCFGLDLEAIEKTKATTDYWFDYWPEVQARPEIVSFIRERFSDPEFYRGIEPFEGAVDVLNSWHRQGHEPLVVTARSHPGVQAVTVQEMFRIGLDWVIDEGRLVFCDSGVDRTVAKPQVCLKFRHHLFIEDHAETLAEIDSPDLMRKIIVDFNYNYNRHLDLGNVTARCFSWSEIDQVVNTCASWHYFLHHL